MKTRFTISYKPKQKIHGCLNWKETWYIDATNRCVIRMRKGKKLLGQICIENTYDRKTQSFVAWVFSFAVNPKYRENGYGTALLRNTEKWIRENLDVDSIRLHVQKEFEKTLVPFYERRGYTRLRRDVNCRNEWIMEKLLWPNLY